MQDRQDPAATKDAPRPRKKEPTPETDAGTPQADAQSSSPRAEPEPLAVEGDVDLHVQEIEDLRARLLRARADYENLRRRIERDQEVERDRVKARVLEAFLPVYEYGRLAEMEARKHPGPLADGVRMVVREFERLLEAQGVRSMGQPGDLFDPARHEAVAEEQGEPGRVVRVVAPGYLLGDRVLEYAKVVVGAGTVGDSEE